MNRSPALTSMGDCSMAPNSAPWLTRTLPASTRSWGPASAASTGTAIAHAIAAAMVNEIGFIIVYFPWLAFGHLRETSRTRRQAQSELLSPADSPRGRRSAAGRRWIGFVHAVKHGRADGNASGDLCGTAPVNARGLLAIHSNDVDARRAELALAAVGVGQGGGR